MQFIVPFMMGISARSKRQEVDYKKWLGPNCPKPEYEGNCGMHVINHISPLDVLVQVFLMKPSSGFLGKREGLKIPGAAALTAGLEFMLTGRETKDSKEVRE